MELHIHYIEKENKYEIKKQVTEKKIRVWKTVVKHSFPTSPAVQ